MGIKFGPCDLTREALGRGATGVLRRREKKVAPGRESSFTHQTALRSPEKGLSAQEIVRLEAQKMGDAEGVFFEAMGTGHRGLYHYWEEKRFGFIRLLVVNGSAQDWSESRVTITYPDGWRGQHRPAGLWISPDNLMAAPISAELGAIPSCSRAVAPFWVLAPDNTPIQKPDFIIAAELSARTAEGREIRRKLNIPVAARW